MNTVVEPSTGQTVDLIGLSPEEKLYCAFLEHVDPKTFDGESHFDCLCGQIAEPVLGLRACNCGCGAVSSSYEPEDLAEHFGLAYETFTRIYARAAAYEKDYDGALAMAREELGLDDQGRLR
jgi:hypothetical protein